jgi:hypothetical protein
MNFKSELTALEAHGSPLRAATAEQLHTAGRSSPCSFPHIHRDTLSGKAIYYKRQQSIGNPFSPIPSLYSTAATLPNLEDPRTPHGETYRIHSFCARRTTAIRAKQRTRRRGSDNLLAVEADTGRGVERASPARPADGSRHCSGRGAHARGGGEDCGRGVAVANVGCAGERDR